ncbi:hypothetical protein OAC41_05520 [Acidimicrobiales bacterium]|nr:hypothetical protein [Acidimicrobiales bacterium]
MLLDDYQKLTKHNGVTLDPKLFKIQVLADRAVEAQAHLAAYVAELSGDDEVHLHLRVIDDLRRTALLLVQESTPSNRPTTNLPKGA